MLNLQMRNWGREFQCDPLTPQHRLTAGLQQILEFAPGNSDDPELKGVAARRTWQVRFPADYETMVFQAVRP
jgi:hypothetical protein